MLKNSATHYGVIGRVLHWTSVALMVGTLAYGVQLGDNAWDPTSTVAVSRHMSFGLLLLALMLLRFAWRINNLNPLRSYSIRRWQRRAAISVHWFLYAAVGLQCCIGIGQVVADGSTIAIFEMLRIDASSTVRPHLRELLNDMHANIANLIYIALALHVCSAIYHQMFGVVEFNDV